MATLKKFKDPKNPKIIHTFSPGPNGLEHRTYISAKECEKETLENLKKWRNPNFLDWLYYKLTGKIR